MIFRLKIRKNKDKNTETTFTYSQTIILA
ncbi:uncharacterized protein METZ01_LOCUS74000 [marine metagenome]|uniref:Uncharacterized protein n=1 Tax=marine metagenome TaxID=408172 RepID=A0A381TYP2_9ZZZZ